MSAAADLFARHSVGGTSLQMIADAIGVTKAAVYHQFRTKEEIVIAVAEDELARLEAVIDDADAEQDPDRKRDVLIARIVDLAVESRRRQGSLAGDPVLVRFFARHEPYRRVMDRLYWMLTGAEADAEERLSAALLTAAIGGAAMHPLTIDLDDDLLRNQLRFLARRFLGLPG